MKKTLLIIPALALCAASPRAQQLEPATFEDLGLPADTHWIGDTDDEDYFMGTFRSGSFEFNNLYWADYDTWSFFGYASHTDPAFHGSYATDQWNCTAGSGHDSPTYGVLYDASFMGPSVVTIPDFAETGVTVPGMWVCNAAWTADAIVNGDGQSGPFERWDALMLDVWGVHPDGSESLAEMLLADYTLDDEADWYAVNDWRWMDLSCLGDVVSLRFSIDSTKVSDWGVTTPTYVCFDDLGAGVSVGVEAVATLSASDFRVTVRGGSAAVSGTMPAFDVTALTPDGMTAATAIAADGRATVSLAPGVNLLRISSPCGSLTLKVMNR